VLSRFSITFAQVVAGQEVVSFESTRNVLSPIAPKVGIGEAAAWEIGVRAAANAEPAFAGVLVRGRVN
jgi:hypothetical protein